MYNNKQNIYLSNVMNQKFFFIHKYLINNYYLNIKINNNIINTKNVRIILVLYFYKTFLVIKSVLKPGKII